MSELDRLPLTGIESEDLLREVLGRVQGAQDEQARLRLLLDAVVSMAADLTLDGVLTRIVETARELVGARYAALGVLGTGPHQRLRSFVHTGMSSQEVSRIGGLPSGQGLPDLLIDRPEPLRLDDLADDLGTTGFPAERAPRGSFLGVPIRIRGTVFGNLYLTEKVPEGPFSQEDEDIVVALAAAAGVAIENARLYEETSRRERWLAASAEISALLLNDNPASGRQALQTVADRAREVSGADMSWIVLGTPEELTLQVVSGQGASLADLVGISLDQSLSREVILGGEPVVAENAHLDDRAQEAQRMGWPAMGPVIVVPLCSPMGVQGTLALGWTPANAERVHAVDADLPARFAEQAALVLQVSRSRETEQRLAVLEDRDRIGRDLHDVVVQRLFAVGLGLQSLGRLADAPPAVTQRIEAAVDELDATIKDIRRSIFALGNADNAADIQTEVTRMVERAAATLKFQPSLRLQGPVRTLVDAEVAPHLLAVLSETLSNAARHAEPSAVDVTITAGEELRLIVTDDGRGLPDEVRESGLRNMRERAEQLGGKCEVESSAWGTMVTWVVPLG